MKHILLCLSLLGALELSAQETTEHVKHRVSLGLGHTHVPQGELADGNNKLAFASWTFDYDFHFNEHWAIGLQTDLILESFVIIRRNEEEIEREYPFSITPVAL